MPPKITVIAPSLASHLRICRELEEARLSQNPKAVEVSRALLSIITTTAQQRNFQIFSPRKLSAFEVLKKRDLTGCTFYHPVLLTQPRKIWRSPKKIFTESDLVPNANVAKIGLKRHTRWKYQPCRPSLHGRVIRVFWVSRVAKFHLWGPLVHYCCS